MNTRILWDGNSPHGICNILQAVILAVEWSWKLYQRLSQLSTMHPNKP